MFIAYFCRLIRPTIEKKANTTRLAAEVAIAQLKAGRTSFLLELDNNYRAAFVKWSGRRFTATPNDLEDAWQEALVLFYEQVMSGKLTTLHCAANTYLFAIGGNYLRNLNRKMRRVLWQDEADKLMQLEAANKRQLPETEWEEEREILGKTIALLPEKCRDMLVARHYNGHSISEIKEQFQIASENAVSVHLSNCLSKLKIIVQQYFPKNGR